MNALKISCMLRTIIVSRIAASFSWIDDSSRTGEWGGAPAGHHFGRSSRARQSRSWRLPLVDDVNRVVVLDGNHHGLENVNIPAIGNAQADRVIGFRQQAASQRHAKLSRCNSEDYRLPQIA